MIKKTMLLIFSVALMLNLCGCFALIAGVAGGAGTAVWLSGKLTEEFHAPYEATINAAQLAAQSLKLNLVKETHEESVTQLKGSYTDGREMWIDIHRVSKNSTKVEVRVGGVKTNKEAASIVLKKIEEYLFGMASHGVI